MQEPKSEPKLTYGLDSEFVYRLNYGYEAI